MSECACVRAYVRACVRGFVCVCASARACAFECVRVSPSPPPLPHSLTTAEDPVQKAGQRDLVDELAP